jgi:pyruvate formate lyase activating enzyme
MHNGEITGYPRTAGEVVRNAAKHNCASISYTYVEPTIFFEFALDTARLASEQGIMNIFVSNGYTSPEATREIAPYLNANNIDLKAFSDRFYREVCGARLQPVLDCIRLMKELGVWVEVTTLLIPDWNDSDQELQDIAEFIRSVDPNIPWHVTRFHPTYQMTDHNTTPLSTLERARDIGLAAGLNYVYTGNLPGIEGENTFCPECNATLISRTGFRAEITGMEKDSCHSCGMKQAGIFA